MLSYDTLRAQMVAEQLLLLGIADAAVLSAMGQVPREAFVPPDLQPRAYEDGPLPIGFNQTISQPYIVALMTEAARLKGGDRVLEVGSGSGYQAAILAEMGYQVTTIERVPELAARAEEVLGALGYGVVCKTGDGALGWPEGAPYDAILVTAGAKRVPESLREQLKIGGRMIIPVGPLPFQELIRVTRREEEDYSEEILCGVAFVPLIT